MRLIALSITMLVVAVTSGSAQQVIVPPGATATDVERMFLRCTTTREERIWHNCVVRRALALGRGPDAATVVARAALSACEPERMNAWAACKQIEGPGTAVMVFPLNSPTPQWVISRILQARAERGR